jgi:hypothetical protein
MTPSYPNRQRTKSNGHDTRAGGLGSCWERSQPVDAEDGADRTRAGGRQDSGRSTAPRRSTATRSEPCHRVKYPAVADVEVHCVPVDSPTDAPLLRMAPEQGSRGSSRRWRPHIRPGAAASPPTGAQYTSTGAQYAPGQPALSEKLRIAPKHPTSAVVADRCEASVSNRVSAAPPPRTWFPLCKGHRR